MIFVTVGTWHKGFDRLIAGIDQLAARGIVKEEIVAQVGYGSYKPHNLKAIDFCSPQEFMDFIGKSRVMISHAGVGSMAGAIKLGKPVVVVPRQPELGEVDNDHQFATARQLEAEGKILVAYEIEELGQKLIQADNFKPAREEGSQGIQKVVGNYLNKVCLEKADKKPLWKKLWPYHILRRDDQGIQADLKIIMDHFLGKNASFDQVVFVPRAGIYLAEMFRKNHCNHYQIEFMTVRRASTISPPGRFKQYIFQRKWLSNIMRHVEVLLRLIKLKLGARHQRVIETENDFDVKGRRVLVIDDSVDTGTTLQVIKEKLLARGAAEVTTACISNHLAPRLVAVDFSVYEYALLRTCNSRDFHAS